jgi:hypothetical protein
MNTPEEGYNNNSGTRRNRSNRATTRRRTFIRTPPFHYTQSQERRAWTCAIYPHADVFLKVPGSIPWHTWYYGDSRATYAAYSSKHGARFNDTPYYALGGTVEEIFNRIYKRDIPADEDLHVRTDPTGDLDIRICPLTVRNPTNGPYDSYYERKLYESPNAHVKLQPYFENCANWLVDRIAEYFRPMEAKLNQMFPTALPFVKDYDEQSRNARRIERVGPLTIIYTTFLQFTGQQDYTRYYVPITKVQVKLTLPQPDIIARAATGGRNYFKFTKHVIQDHMIEMGFWENPNAECEYQSFYYKPYKLHLRTIAGEVYGCYSGLTQRLEFLYEPVAIHKCVNYIYRLRFLLYIVYANYVKYAKKKRPIETVKNKNYYNVKANYEAGMPYDEIKEIAETVQKILNMLIKNLHGRRGIWFVYYEIANTLREPILQLIDTKAIATNLGVFTGNYVLKSLSEDAKKTMAEESGFAYGTPEYNRFALDNYMNIFRERYIFPTPVKCDEAVPAEFALVEAEKKRRAEEPKPAKPPTLGELVARDNLREERRGRSLFKPPQPNINWRFKEPMAVPEPDE